MIRNIREAREEEGFTLIELLVVVIIIGILAAIAIPVFLNQRTSSYVATAESDVRNAAIEVETYFTTNDAYPADDATFQGLAGVQSSTNVNMVYVPTAGVAGGAYDIVACHELISGAGCTPTVAANDARYDSDAGGLQ